MDQNLKTAGWLNVALGTLTAGVGLYLLWEAWSGEDGGVMGLGIFVRYYLGGIMALLGLLYVAAGAGLTKGKRWAKVLIVVVSAIGLLSFPLGTAVGAYTIWAVARAGSDMALK